MSNDERELEGPVKEIEEKAERILEELRELLERRAFDRIRELASKLHPHDFARALRDLSEEEALHIISKLPDDLAARILNELPDRMIVKFLSEIDPDRAASILDKLPADDAADILDLLPEDLKLEVFSRLSKEAQQDVGTLLLYPPDTAGGIMTTEFLALDKDLTVEEALDVVRRFAGEFESLYYLYVVDEEDRLVGVLSFRELILAPPDKRLEEIAKKDVIKVHPLDDQEKVARLISEYDLLAIPVVDENNRLLGVVTIDDVVDVIESEASEDITKIGGTLPLEYSYAESTPLEMIRKRAVWLMILFFAEAITSNILKYFESTLQTVIALAFFIPLLLDTAGNTGSQAATLVIRSLALGEIRPHLKDIVKIVGREVLTGVGLGILMGLVGVLLALLLGLPKEIGLVVALAMISIVVVANIVGTLLPILLDKIGVDPAVVSAPLITTIADATGLIVYFQVAKTLLGI